LGNFEFSLLKIVGVTPVPGGHSLTDVQIGGSTPKRPKYGLHKNLNFSGLKWNNQTVLLAN